MRKLNDERIIWSMQSCKSQVGESRHPPNVDSSLFARALPQLLTWIRNAAIYVRQIYGGKNIKTQFSIRIL